MNIFFVFQGKTFEQELEGGYVWSPKRARNDSRNAGFTTVSEIRCGDYIFHSQDTNIKALSIAISDCKSAEKPNNLRNIKSASAWNIDGYKVDCEYILLEKQLGLHHHRQWLRDNYDADSPFTKSGLGRQRYMCHMPHSHAEYLLNKAISLQPVNSDVYNKLLDIYKLWHISLEII